MKLALLFSPIRNGLLWLNIDRLTVM